MRISALIAATIILAAPGALHSQSTQADQQSGGVTTTSKGVLVDFQDADLKFVLSALAEAGGINLVFTDLPPKHVTLHMRQPVAPSDVLPLLKSLATSNGLTVTEDGGLVRVEPVDTKPTAKPVADTTRTQRDTSVEPRLMVYRLRHVQAGRIASTLQAIFGGRGSPGQAASISTPALTQSLNNVQQGSGSSSFGSGGGGGGGFGTTGSLPAGLDGPQRSTVSTTSSTSGSGGGGGAMTGKLRGEILIVPDEINNDLLIRARPDDYLIIKQAIAAMDLRPLQVLIEVLIAEVQETKSLNVSTQLSASHQTASDTSPDLLASLTGDLTNNFLLSFAKTGVTSVGAALSALAARGHVQILSRPVILAENNQEAHVLVGSEQPFVQVSQTQVGSVVQNQVVQYRDVGTQLTILPTINLDGYVNLQIQQQVSNATTDIQFGAPVISTREATTRLFLHDGQTAVIGGLVDHEIDKSKSGIPILMDIPLLGALFRTTSNSVTNDELFLFVTPHIISTDDDTDRLREEVHDRNKDFSKVVPPSADEMLVPPTPDRGAPADSAAHASVESPPP